MDSYHFNLFFVVFAYLIAIAVCQDSAVGSCRVWGDPHLLMFPLDEAQEDLRMSYRCTQIGSVNILKNKYIEVSVNVTDDPFWNHEFTIKLLSDRQVLCTITRDQRDCSHPFLNVTTIGTGTDIVHLDSDGLYLTVNSYLVDNRTIFDIDIIQPYSLTKESTGACAVRPTTCRLENASPLGRRRKRNADREWATKVCDLYMKEAFKTARALIGNEGSLMTNHARAACITDVSITKSHEWGKSAIGFVMMDALKKARLGRADRRKKLEQVIPAINKAASRAGELVFPLISSPVTPPILTK